MSKTERGGAVGAESSGDKGVEGEKTAEKEKKGSKRGSGRLASDRLSQNFKDIETLDPFPWFHGFLSREDVSSLLKHHGDFLVRISKTPDGERDIVVLSAYVSFDRPGGKRTEGDHIKHFIFGHRAEGYHLNDKKQGPFAPTIPELVELHRRRKRPVVSKNTEFFLLKGIPKADWELDHEEIVLSTKLGKGAFGEVFKGTLHHKGTVKEVAVKSCTNTGTKEDLQTFTKEARIMRTYSHPNIVKLIGLAAKRAPLYIVMELAPGGSLLDYLKKTWPGPEETEQIRIITDVAKGMEYLESKNCIHKDLAARNCLLDSARTVKISDFGLSSIAKAEQVLSGMRLPIKWAAPESLAECTFSSKSDVWSYGILVSEVWTGGSEPYPGKTTSDVRKGIFEGLRTTLPDHMPAELKLLLNKCWELDPHQRPSFNKIKLFLNSNFATSKTSSSLFSKNPANNPVSVRASK